MWITLLYIRSDKQSGHKTLTNQIDTELYTITWYVDDNIIQILALKMCCLPMLHSSKEFAQLRDLECVFWKTVKLTMYVNIMPKQICQYVQFVAS